MSKKELDLKSLQTALLEGQRILQDIDFDTFVKMKTAAIADFKHRQQAEDLRNRSGSQKKYADMKGGCSQIYFFPTPQSLDIRAKAPDQNGVLVDKGAIAELALSVPFNKFNIFACSVDKNFILSLETAGQIFAEKILSKEKSKYKLLPLLIKQGEQIYLYGLVNDVRQLTLLDAAPFKKVKFPQPHEEANVLSKKSINKDIYSEIQDKNAHHVRKSSTLTNYANNVRNLLVQHQVDSTFIHTMIADSQGQARVAPKMQSDLKNYLETKKISYAQGLRLIKEFTLAISDLQKPGAKIQKGKMQPHYGLAHRDIKPANILITSDDHLKLADWDLATSVNERGQSEEPNASFLGNIGHHAAPEVLSTRTDKEQYQQKNLLQADIYSWGAVVSDIMDKMLSSTEEKEDWHDRLVFRAQQAKSEDPTQRPDIADIKKFLMPDYTKISIGSKLPEKFAPGILYLAIQQIDGKFTIQAMSHVMNATARWNNDEEKDEGHRRYLEIQNILKMFNREPLSGDFSTPRMIEIQAADENIIKETNIIQEITSICGQNEETAIREAAKNSLVGSLYSGERYLPPHTADASNIMPLEIDAIDAELKTLSNQYQALKTLSNLNQHLIQDWEKYKKDEDPVFLVKKSISQNPDEIQKSLDTDAKFMQEILQKKLTSENNLAAKISEALKSENVSPDHRKKLQKYIEQYSSIFPAKPSPSTESQSATVSETKSSPTLSLQEMSVAKVKSISTQHLIDIVDMVGNIYKRMHGACIKDEKISLEKSEHQAILTLSEKLHKSSTQSPAEAFEAILAFVQEKSSSSDLKASSPTSALFPKPTAIRPLLKQHLENFSKVYEINKKTDKEKTSQLPPKSNILALDQWQKHLTSEASPASTSSPSA